jgi:putative oxidoreductase
MRQKRFDAALLVLRLVLGAIFIAHGGQKLFVFGLDGVTAAFTQMGAPLPAITAPLTAFVELLGGAALVIGLLTRLSAVGLAIVMVGAIGLAHLSAGFFNPNGFEFPLSLLGTSIALALTGAGTYSIDARFGRARNQSSAHTPAASKASRIAA